MWKDKNFSDQEVDALETFNVHCPVFHLLRKLEDLYESCVEPFEIDADVMLVCKYLKAHRDKSLDHLCSGMYLYVMLWRGITLAGFNIQPSYM